MTEFKKTLAALRQYRGMTQDDLAKASGVSKNAIARYEAGENLPGMDNTLKLAEALDCSTDHLLGRVPLIP